MSWIVTDSRRVALHVEGPLLPLEVGDGDLEHARGDDLRLVADLAGHQRGGRSRHRRRPAAVGAEPERRVVGVAVHHVDVVGRDADLLGDDLRERRLVALALALHRQPYDGLAGRVHAQLAAVGHPEPQDVHVLAGTGADGLGEERDADPHQLAALALLGLLAPQLVVPGHVEADVEGALVLAGVVDPAGLGGVGELVGLDEVLPAQRDRVHLELVGQAVDDPLDEVDRLGDPERAGVGDAAGGLVGVDRGHVAVGGLEVVAAGEDAEEAGGVLHRRRRAVERAVVGEHVGADREDLAVLGRGDLAAHDVVAREAGGHEVLGAVLHPLDRLAGQQRADDRADVAGVDRHLVAEAAADVGRDDPDLVLGQARDDGVERAVRVRRLGGRPERELAVDAVEVGDRSRRSPSAPGARAGRRCPR